MCKWNYTFWCKVTIAHKHNVVLPICKVPLLNKNNGYKICRALRTKSHGCRDFLLQKETSLHLSSEYVALVVTSSTRNNFKNYSFKLKKSNTLDK